MDRERRRRWSRGPEPPAGRPHPSLSSVLARAVGTEAQGHRTPGGVPGAQTRKGSSWFGFEGLLGGCRSGRADIKGGQGAWPARGLCCWLQGTRAAHGQPGVSHRQRPRCGEAALREGSAVGACGSVPAADGGPGASRRALAEERAAPSSGSSVSRTAASSVFPGSWVRYPPGLQVPSPPSANFLKRRYRWRWSAGSSAPAVSGSLWKSVS